jgi:hypothetical protein
MMDAVGADLLAAIRRAVGLEIFDGSVRPELGYTRLAQVGMQVGLEPAAAAAHDQGW